MAYPPTDPCQAREKSQSLADAQGLGLRPCLRVAFGYGFATDMTSWNMRSPARARSASGTTLLAMQDMFGGNPPATWARPQISRGLLRRNQTDAAMTAHRNLGPAQQAHGCPHYTFIGTSSPTRVTPAARKPVLRYAILL